MQASARLPHSCGQHACTWARMHACVALLPVLLAASLCMPMCKAHRSFRSLLCITPTQNLRGPSCEASGGVPFVPSGSSLAGAAAAQRNGPSSSTPAGGPAAQVQHVTFASAPGMPAPAAVAAAAMAESPFASGPDALAAPHAADVLPGTVADA